jgi:hypothetical protein
MVVPELLLIMLDKARAAQRRRRGKVMGLGGLFQDARHCGRSEAIQRLARRALWIASPCGSQ